MAEMKVQEVFDEIGANLDELNAKIGSSAFGSGGKYATVVVGHVDSGHTLADCDYLCDGEDDSGEINAALKGLPWSGGKVILLEGYYHLMTRVVIPYSNVVLMGMGGSTVLYRSANMSSPNNQSIYCQMTNCEIKDLTVEGAGGGYGIYLAKGYNKVTNTLCTYFDFGIYVESQNNLIRDDRVSNCGYGKEKGHGIYIIGEYNTVMNNHCDKNANTGIHIRKSNNTVTGNRCVENGLDGVELEGEVTLEGGKNIIMGNTCHKNTRYGIRCKGVGMTLTGNSCDGNGSSGIALRGSETATVTGNTCRANKGSGLYVNDEVYFSTFSGNTFIRNERHGIHLDNPECIFTANISNENEGYGIYFDECSGENIIIGNLVEGNREGEFSAEPYPNIWGYNNRSI